jgi:hypothetical protein
VSGIALFGEGEYARSEEVIMSPPAAGSSVRFRPISDREFEIQFFEPGVAAFDLTFG